MKGVAGFSAYFRRPPMVLKNVFPALLGAALLAWSGLAAADEYRPDQFLGLDLRGALLSPKPLGPASRFVPGPLDVTVGSTGAQASVEPKPEPKEPQAESGVQQAEPRVRHAESRVRQAESRSVMHKTRKAGAEKPLRAEQPRGAARTKLARRHGNPLDAQAFDTRIQVWPCRSGGICNWKR